MFQLKSQLEVIIKNMYGNQKYFANMDGLQARLRSYSDRRALAVIKTFHFWLYDMPRTDRKAWATRGAQIIAQIDKAQTLSLRDKSGIDNFINYSIDKEEAFYLTGHSRRNESDDESS